MSEQVFLTATHPCGKPPERPIGELAAITFLLVFIVGLLVFARRRGFL